MGQGRSIENAALFDEVMRLGERLEAQLRYIEVVEQKLRETQASIDGASVELSASDAIPPLNGGASCGAEVGGRPAYPAFRRTTASARELRLEDEWWPSHEVPGTPMVPTAGWRNYTLQRKAPKVIGISVCGLSQAQLESAVSSIAAAQSQQRDFVPVFLTDSKHFDVFRRHGFVWGYLPGPDCRARYGGSMSWTEYARSRRELLKRKWGLDKIVVIGRSEFGVVPAPAGDIQA